jgi:hypothetical protein
MAVALSIFISRKPHFSQVPRWPLLLASCVEAIIGRAYLVYGWPHIQLHNGVVPSAQNTPWT